MFQSAFRMELEWKRLQHFSSQIVMDLNIHRLIDELFSKEIIDLNSKQEIQRMDMLSSEKAARLLLDEILKCPPEKNPVQEFCFALKKHNSWLADELMVSAEEIENPFQQNQEKDELLALPCASEVGAMHTDNMHLLGEFTASESF